MSIYSLGQKVYTAPTTTTDLGFSIDMRHRTVENHEDVELFFVDSNDSTILTPIEVGQTYLFKYDFEPVSSNEINTNGHRFKLCDEEHRIFQSIGRSYENKGYIVFTPVERDVDFTSLWCQSLSENTDDFSEESLTYTLELIDLKSFNASHIGVRGYNGDVVVINGESIELGRREIFEMEMDVDTFGVAIVTDAPHNIYVDYVTSEESEEEEDDE